MKEALTKLQVEITTNSKNKYVQVVGGFLINHVRNNPEDAQLIMAEGKTIVGSLEAMKAEGKKNQSNGVGVLTDQEGFAVVLKYFGVKVPEVEPTPTPPAEFNVSLDDLL